MKITSYAYSKIFLKMGGFKCNSGGKNTPTLGTCFLGRFGAYTPTGKFEILTF